MPSSTNLVSSLTTISPNGIEIVTETESKFENVDSNVYYIKRLNSTSFKLARSRADIFSNKFVSLVGEVTDNEFIYFDFFNKKELEPQGIVREVLTPDNKSGNYETDPGYTGILINGVEILNYKSGDSLKYGDIRSLEITGQMVKDMMLSILLYWTSLMDMVVVQKVLYLLMVLWLVSTSLIVVLDYIDLPQSQSLVVLQMLRLKLK